MADVYSEFFKKKSEILDLKKEEEASETLKYYHKISYMMTLSEYESHESFLYSIFQFIEDKEYITDKQKEAVDKIYDNILL